MTDDYHSKAEGTTNMLLKAQEFLCFILLAALPFQCPVLAHTRVSIDDACRACKAAGSKPIGEPIQSPLKKETSLIGLAYINYIYQNDLTNAHYCQAMLHMQSQVPPGTTNPYTKLFDTGHGEHTLAVLEDIQLAFDYSIGRSSPTDEKIQASIERIRQSFKGK